MSRSHQVTRSILRGDVEVEPAHCIDGELLANVLVPIEGTDAHYQDIVALGPCPHCYPRKQPEPNVPPPERKKLVVGVDPGTEAHWVAKHEHDDPTPDPPPPPPKRNQYRRVEEIVTAILLPRGDWCVVEDSGFGYGISDVWFQKLFEKVEPKEEGSK